MKSDLNILFNREKFDRLRHTTPIFSSTLDSPNRDSKPEKELKTKNVEKKQKEKEPTTAEKNLESKKISKLAPGFSEWFNGETRAHWKRPCFNGFQTVVMGDSQLKIYGQNNKRRAGFSITSYSGCDVSVKTRV